MQRLLFPPNLQKMAERFEIISQSEYSLSSRMCYPHPVNTVNRIVVYGITALAAICLLAAGTCVLFAPVTENGLGESEIGLANPAAVWCEEMGYRYEIRADTAGNQYGVCILPNGTERNAWEAYREAHPDGGAPQPDGDTGEEGMVVLNATDNGETVTFEVGRVFAVHLEENPSTGYTWTLNVTEGLIQDSEGFEAVSDDRELEGAPVVHTWTFHADLPGTYSIEGVYARPWEGLTGAEERFNITVEIVSGEG
jgi:predicted secreted protein/putative hemolysin